MNFLKLQTTDPYRNLAIEEYLFRTVTEATLMLWQNAPSVILGKNQSAYAEIDLGYAERHGIRIARRITGGGAVYHDPGNLNYTLISSDTEESTLDFESFSRPILDALAALGVRASLCGRNDLEIDGKKFSGNAQHRSGGRVLHHGTLLFDTDFDTMEAVLSPDEEKIRSRAIRSVHARVVNLRTYLPQYRSTAAFCEALSAQLTRTLPLTPLSVPDCGEIDALAERNASREWLYPTRTLLSDYTLIRKQRYPFGTVEIRMEMTEQCIKNIHVTGDFFSIAPIEELESTIRGVTLQHVKDVLCGIEIGAYICGMNETQLLALLTDNEAIS